MAKTRLRIQDRDKLIAHANTKISFPKLEAARDKATELAESAVKRVIAQAYPADDLATLAKYNLMTEVSDVHLKRDHDGYIHYFRFSETGAVKVPQNRRYDSGVLSASVAVFKKIIAAEKAETALNDAISELQSKYRAVIHGTRYYEDLLGLWPEAAQVELNFVSVNLPVPQEAIEAVQAHYKATIA